MRYSQGERSPENEQRRRPRPALRPHEIDDLASQLSLDSLSALSLQTFARAMLRDAMRHVNAAEVEEQRLRAIASAFKRHRYEMAAPRPGGRRDR